MSNASGSFVVKVFDEFKDVTTTTHVFEFVYKSGIVYVFTATFRIQRLQSKDLDAPLLHMRIDYPLDWFHAKNGGLILNCDQENIELKFIESGSNASHIGKNIYCTEVGQYLMIHQSFLERICAAKVLKIRIYGSGGRIDPEESWCKDFQSYCQQFYNNVYDQKMYISSVVDGPKRKSGGFIAPLARFVWRLIN